MCPATVWIISGLRSPRQNDTTPAPELFFHEHGSSTGALGFYECGFSSGALFLHGSGSSSGFCSFSHINILIVLVCLNLNGKRIKSSTQD